MSRSNYIQLRFSDDELAAYDAAAQKAKLPRAVWARETLNERVKLKAADDSRESDDSSIDPEEL